MYTQQDLERLSYDEIRELMKDNQRYFHARELVAKLLSIGNMTGKNEVEFGSLFMRIPKEYGLLSVWKDYSGHHGEEYSMLVLEVVVVSSYNDEDIEYVPNFDSPLTNYVSLLDKDVVAQVDQLYNELVFAEQQKREQATKEKKTNLINRIFERKNND